VTTVLGPPSGLSAIGAVRHTDRIKISMTSMMSDIVLYSRNGCHLCDVAAEILARHGLEFERVNVDAEPELRARYDACVPVVVIDGRERFRGRIDELLLRRLLSHRGAS
jgi:glutaredoxin